MRPGLHRSRLRAALSLAAALVLLGVAFVAAPSVALILAPSLVLLAVLAVGIFPGEETLARARDRRARPRVSRRPVRIALPALADVLRPAGLTLAYALAVRPPPAR